MPPLISVPPRTRRWSIIVAFTLALSSAVAIATSFAQTTIFVDNGSAACSSTGPGTEASPYCTISAAAAAWKGPGVTILVKPGTYREQVTIPASGSASAPYVFRSTAPGVVIDGSDDFANTALWAASLGTTYRAASVTWTPKQVFVDGARLTPSTLPPDILPAGSFCWVAGAGLYVNLGGDSPGTHQTFVGRRNHGFNIFTKSFVTMDGFAVSHTEDRGIHIQTGCSDLVVARNAVTFANSYGIHTINGQRIVIEQNTVSDCNFHGIGLTAGASGCTVRDNESFRNADPTIRQANGIHLFGAPANTISGNRLHENQDTGLQFGPGSNDCISVNNRSYWNGDHGFDHIGAANTSHVNDLAYGNFRDGFSFEGASAGAQVHNCIAVENGIAVGNFDLWVDGTSSAGFVSDHNIFWNSTNQSPIKFVATLYPALSAFQAATGLDMHSRQADPRFADPGLADFTLRLGSPAIDAAHSGIAGWPVTDADSRARVDDPHTSNAGAGPVGYSDIGPFERAALDSPPVVTSPVIVAVARDGEVMFMVSASDPDGDDITSLVMIPVKMPPNSGATFTPNSTNAEGTFKWSVGSRTGGYRVSFVATSLWASDTSLTVIEVKSRLRSEIPEVMLSEGLPQAVTLSSGFPNPSSDGVVFALGLPSEAQVELIVLDLQGRRVWSEQRALASGRVRLHWDGTTSTRQRAGAGLYLVRVRVGGDEFVRRVIRF